MSKTSLDKMTEDLIRGLVIQHNAEVRALMLDSVEVKMLELLTEWPRRQRTAKNFATYFVLSLNVINKRLNRMQKMGYVVSVSGAGTLRYWSVKDSK